MNRNALKTKNPAELLALWIAQNQPHVFKALTAEANKSGQLNGITDWLSSVGSSLGTAVKSVGSFLTSPAGLASLTTAGGLYLQTQAQKDALKLQVAQAQAGYPPQPVYSAGANGQATYYVDPSTGRQYPLTPELTNYLQPAKTIKDYLPWIGLAGGGLLLMFVLGRK